MKNIVAAFFRLTILMLFPAVAFSTPQGELVVHGHADFTRSEGGTLEISASDRAIINYESFHIAEHERVRFVQPGKTSCVLNRVVGGDPSKILGALESNGRVFLVNPNGIYFGAAATVHVGSLVASTLNVQDQDFLNDHFRFHMDRAYAKSSIEHFGNISSPEGAIVFLAPHIKNEGVIAAKAGNVFFGAAESVTLDFSGDGLVSFILDGDLEEATIEHLGSASGDAVFMKMKVANRAIRDVINTDGIEEGNVITQENGVIRIAKAGTISADSISIEGSDHTKVVVEGMLTAPSGMVEVLGDHIELYGASIDVSGELSGGSVFIGGDYKGLGDRKTAKTTMVDAHSTICADAIEQGNGGTVIVWSDSVTFFDGAISAEGGRLVGDGGFVETSGKQGLNIQTGHVTTLADKGKHGTWLLDPDILTVATAGGATYAQVQCGAGTNVGNYTVSPTTLDSVGGNVCLEAKSSFVISDPIALSTATASLTFRASAAST